MAIGKPGLETRYAITYNMPSGQGGVAKKGRPDRIRRGLVGGTSGGGGGGAIAKEGEGFLSSLDDGPNRGSCSPLCRL